MKNYVDGLASYQKLYNTSFFLLFLNSVVLYLKREHNFIDPMFSTVPVIGIKLSDDASVMILLLIFSLGMSIWVSIGLAWWLYSFNKHHPTESLDVEYLPGMLFMPSWMRFLVGVIMLAMHFATWLPKPPATQITLPNNLIITFLLIVLIQVLPLIITTWVVSRFKQTPRS